MQGPKVDDELLLRRAHRDTLGRVMPPSHFAPDRTSAEAGRPQGFLLPPKCEPRDGPPSPLLPLTLGAPGTRLLKNPYKGAHFSLPSLTLEDPRPVPPIRNHLPLDAVAYRTIPFTLGLSRMLMINSHLVSPALTLPPQSLMDNTYSALNKRIRDALLREWATLFPTPGYYRHPPALPPRPFMGLGKFVAGRIHQMRAGKCYLAAHPTWRSPNADSSCPRCGFEPQTLAHTILSCLSRQHSRSRLLHGLTDVGHKAPIWMSLPWLKRLATFISVTSTGFPPTIFPPTTPPSSPPLPLSPPTVPPPVFGVFSPAEV